MAARDMGQNWDGSQISHLPLATAHITNDASHYYAWNVIIIGISIVGILPGPPLLSWEQG